MAEWTTLLNAVVAVLPPAAVFFAAYGPYDGTFRDNVVFLYFIGGLLMGGLLGFISLVALGAQLNPFLLVVLLALFWPIAMVAGINRRKWQGDRHAVFNGGAFGLGVATMMGFTFLYRIEPTFSWGGLGRSVVLSAVFAGLFFGMGLLGGDAVRRRAQFRTSFLGTAILIAPSVFLVEYVFDQALLWLGLLLAYAVIFAVAAERRILIQGVPEEARKQRRRMRRRET